MKLKASYICVKQILTFCIKSIYAKLSEKRKWASALTGRFISEY